ncbi:MAG: hypothetical protein KatS3mg035_2027 [Bacteroidia bacterium]|nr:MAG: hypothetical protein KatS3mg035_2027 [Bacteroidia bacterium]
MKIQEFIQHLQNLETLRFALPNGKLIPEHFHITEIGKKSKHFVDCGNTIRKENKISFQLWYASDYEHRLSPTKLLKIIKIAEPIFQNENLEIEVEYQTDLTIGIFDLTFKEGIFYLTEKYTTCLATDHCGIPTEKIKVPLKNLGKKNSCCSNESNGC